MPLTLDGTNGITFPSGNTQSNAALVTTGGTISGNLTVSNSIALGTGTIASGIGIAFPANQSASSDANTLDDYEEGTWTVTDASGAGLALINTTCTYTKVGRMVFFAMDIAYPSTANTSSAALSLPFTAAIWRSGAISAIANGYGSGNFSADVYPNNNVILFYNATTLASQTNANMSGREVAISGWYVTAT